MTTKNIEFIRNIKENFSESQNNKKFTVLLNGQKDIEDQLSKFKRDCESYDQHKRKQNKNRRYYNLALMAKIENKTTHEEVKRLLKNYTRTFLLDTVTHTSDELKYLINFIKHAEAEQQSEDPNIKLITGLALQITGDACRIGRIRNNSSVFLNRSDNITLTTDMTYRYSSFKEIAFVINLHHYLPFIKLNDEILIGQEAHGFVIKKLKTALTIHIGKNGIVNSYDLIELPNQCYKLPQTELEEIFKIDLEMAMKLHIDFIALPYIRSLSFLKLLKQKIKTNFALKLIGEIDLDFISRNMIDISSIIKYLDYLWLNNLFSNNQVLNTILLQDIIPTAKCLKKPIIGSVPLEHCNDFKLFENHECLWRIDCMFIEKSKLCNKYPLIVKKLLPIKNYRLAAIENISVVEDVLCHSQAIDNFIIRTISSIECQGIFIYSKCGTAAMTLSRVEIYCPIYVMILMEEPSQNNIEEYNLQVELIKSLNLRRNLKVISYTKDMNECEFNPIDYGIEYSRKCGWLDTGDFIITIEVGGETDDNHAELGVDEDLVLLRAVFVPSQSMGEKFICT